MGYPVCRIKNISGSTLQLYIHEFADGEIYTISDVERDGWARNDDVLAAITSAYVEIHDADGAVSGISNQIDCLKRNLPSIVTPTEPKNQHLMGGFYDEHTFTPESDGEGGYLPETKYKKIESTTHTFRRIWGVKLRVDNYDKKDWIRIFVKDVDGMIAPAGTEVAEFASWNLWVEDGKILCPKAPDEASSMLLCGLYVGMEYHAYSADARYFAANIISTHKDGEEMPS